MRRRQRSERIRLLNTFSKFTNTKDNPIDIEIEAAAMKKVGEAEVGKSGSKRKTPDSVKGVRNDKAKKSKEDVQHGSKQKTPDSVKFVDKDNAYQAKEGEKTNISGDLVVGAKRRQKRAAKKCSIATKKTTRAGDSSSRATRKGKQKVGVEDDSDDFVVKATLTKSDVRMLRTSNLQHRKRFDKFIKHRESKKPTNVSGIRTRTSPMTLQETVCKLNEEQQAVVKRMGLGSLLKMRVDGIPSKLGYYVVDNLDPDGMEVYLIGTTLEINEEVVSNILGVPNGGINIDQLNIDDNSRPMISRWKKQYSKDKVRPNDVSSMILSSADAGELFALNFIVLFVNSMAECSPDGRCSNNFLTKIGNIDMIGKINWARYICNCVRRSKRNWKRDTFSSFYHGPLTFLTLLYVHSTVCDEMNVDIDRSQLPLHTWSMDLLRKRMNIGLKMGGLGIGVLRAETVIHHKEIGSVSKDSRASDRRNMLSIELNDESGSLRDDVVVQGSEIETVHTDAQEKDNNNVAEESNNIVKLFSQSCNLGEGETLKHYDDIAKQLIRYVVNDIEETEDYGTGEREEIEEDVGVKEQNNVMVGNEIDLSEKVGVENDNISVVANECDLIDRGVGVEKQDSESVATEAGLMDTTVNIPPGISVEEMQKEMQEDALEDDYDEEQIKRDYMAKIEAHFSVIYSTKWDIEVMLNEAMEIFPDDIWFENYRETLVQLFKEDKQADSEVKDCNDDGDMDGGTSNDGNDDTIGSGGDGKALVTPTKLNFEEDLPNDATKPDSPIWLTQTTFNIIDRDIMRRSAELVSTKKDVAAQSLDHVDENSLNKQMVVFAGDTNEELRVTKGSSKGKEKVTEEVDIVPVRGNKREIKLGAQVRSPYVRRQVLMGQGLYKDEEKALEYCLSAFGGPNDNLFVSQTGESISRTAMESLASSEEVFSEVINGWANILNYEERYRSQSSPLRCFFNTTVLGDGVLSYELFGFQKRFNWFTEKIQKAAKNNQLMLTLRNVELVFFAHRVEEHYFCVVYDMKNCTIQILDNRKRKGEITDMYKYDVHILTSLFVKYLKKMGHPSVEGIQDAEIVQVDTDWQTKKILGHSGVYTMRSMETYMGGSTRLWFTGFTKEGGVQDRQLDMLRKKYTAKILLSENNTRKDFVQGDIARLYEMDKESRAQIREMADATRNGRISKY